MSIESLPLSIHFMTISLFVFTEYKNMDERTEMLQQYCSLQLVSDQHKHKKINDKMFE